MSIGQDKQLLEAAAEWLNNLYPPRTEVPGSEYKSLIRDKQLREATSRWIKTLTPLGTEVSSSESSSLIRNVFATSLLLRLTDLEDTLQETISVSKNRAYRPPLPEQLRLRCWAHLECLNAFADRLQELAQHLEELRGNSARPPVAAAYLGALADPVRNLLKVDFVYLKDFVRWVADLPIETASERRVLLEIFDQVIAETSKPSDSQYVTPDNIARLVAELANPQPGERVYDPCFGRGNFLVAAWQHAKRSQGELSSPNALLEVAGTEINDSTFLIGLTRMLLAGVESPHTELGNSLERESPNNSIRQGFDVVLANPPIGVKSGKPSHYQHFAITCNDATGLFIQHALAQLKPNGRAVIAVPESFLSRAGDRELRRHLLQQGQVEAVIGLPLGVLGPWTGVSICLLMLRKAGGIHAVKLGQIASEGTGKKNPVLDKDDTNDVIIALRYSCSTEDILKVYHSLRKTAQILPQVNEIKDEVRQHLGVLMNFGLEIFKDQLSQDSINKNIWEVTVSEFANYDWDLSPRRREKGGLAVLLSNLKDVLGPSGSVCPLSSVARLSVGRAIKSVDLLEEPPLERAIGYVRVKDLKEGKIGRISSWLGQEVADKERQWLLRSGDLLLSRSGSIGKAGLVFNGTSGVIASSSLFIIRADQERLDPGYLLAFLASPACQNWLKAQSHGSAVQHLNRAVLDMLPIPLPPLPLQAKAAAHYHNTGTDALAFLMRTLGSKDSEILSYWLADMDRIVPMFAAIDDPPPLTRLEPIVELARKASSTVLQTQVSTTTARWLIPLNQALLPLSGISQVPPGPGLLSVLQNADRGLDNSLNQITGQLPIESQARGICERLRVWIRATIGDLISVSRLRVRSSPASLISGRYSEFSIAVENSGPLPLRNVRMETMPDWGTVEIPYLAEDEVFHFHARGDVPKQGSDLSLCLIWSADTLSGGEVTGEEIQLLIRLTQTESQGEDSHADLGASPYVTGSPLEPEHGHNLFYGREELICKISRQIATHGNVVLLEGNRRTGKTSILKHLEGRSAIPEWLAVYASLQGAEGATEAVGVPTAEVFREIARSIASAMTKLGTDIPLPNGKSLAAGKPTLGVARACREGISAESPFADFRDYLELVLTVLQPLGLGLVLMLDEFDKLQEGIDNGVTSPQVPENIRFLIQTYPKFSAILTGSRRLKRLREEYWSALYGLGTSIPVTALDAESARKVVTEPVRDQLAFSHEAIERVIEVTARHPYLMQCLCNRVFDYAVQTKNRSITASVVNNAALSLVRDNEHFASLWDYAAMGPGTGHRRRQLILLLCARSFKHETHMGFGTLNEQLAQAGVDVEDDPLDADLSYLRELDLIEFSGEIGDGEYRLAIPLMADWIEQQQDADVVVSRARMEAEEENA